MKTADTNSGSFALPDSETGRLIASLDPDRTPLGAPQHWPAALKTTVRLLLPAKAQIVLFWGPDYIALYNDAYAPTIGDKHPRALGRPAVESWTELWDDLEPLLRQVRETGETVAAADRPFYIERHGYGETVYFDISYSPVFDDDGGIGGVLCLVAETTERVRAQAHQAFLLDLEARLRNEIDPVAVIASASEALGRHLAVARAGYAELDPSGERIVVRRDWSDGIPSLVGETRLLDGFGVEIAGLLRRGEIIRVDDCAGDARVAGRGVAETWASIQLRAVVAVPLVKHERLVAFLYLHAPQPRAWQDSDVRTAIEVAERTWAALERARAEQALRESEARLRILNALDEALRASGDAEGAMVAATELLATRLGASRCAYADVDVDNDHFVIRSDHSVPGLASSVGTYRLDLFGARAAADMRAGRTLVVHDVTAELAAGTGRETFQAIGIEAIICCPLVKDGRLVAMMAVHQTERRDWRADEVELVKTAVDRCWAHVERVGAEARLKASEAKFQAIANSIDQLIWSTRPDGFHDYFNDRWYAYTGVPYGSTDGEGWNDVFHPDDRARSWAVWRHSLETGEPYEIEYRLRHRSGQYRWVIGRAHCVRDDEGRITRWFGTCTDVHDLKVAEERLLELNENLEALVGEALAERKLWADVFEMSDALIGVLGPDRRFLAVNRAYADDFERVFGIRPKAGDALPALLARSGVDSSFVVSVWERALAGEVFAITPALCERGAATPCYELRYDTLRDRSGRVIGAIQYGVDVRDRLEREAELADAQDALRQSQKMETVGQLTGGVAHDFNNLLQVVTGNLDMILRNLPPDLPRIRRAADNAMTGAKRAATLTHRLLAFSRRQPLSPKPIDANRLVAGMSQLLGRTLGETIELETRFSPRPLQVEADPNQLENALLNLALNARDAMPDGGRLTIATSDATIEDGAEADIAPGPYVVISVSDTGSGMDEATASRAFEPFFTTKEVGKGTGLGLSMVYGFVKQSGGHVHLRSKPGQGTTVAVYLPRLRTVGGIEEAAVELFVPTGSHEETILVCEDDDDVRAYSVEVLRELGYRVLEAHDGTSALRLLERQEGRVDLLFTDVVLPGGMTGADVAARARALRPELKVLFTTGYARDVIVHDGRLDPGVELITKPFAFADLAARIRAVIDDVPGRT